MLDTRVEIMTTRCDGCAVGAQPCVVIDGGVYGDVKLCRRHWELVMSAVNWPSHQRIIDAAIVDGTNRDLTGALAT